MSLINQMLRDLDARHHHSITTPGVFTSDQRNGADSMWFEKGRRRWLILTLITLAGLGAFLVHQHFGVTVIETELVASNAVASTFQQPVPNAVNTSERLEGVQSKNNTTSAKAHTSPTAAEAPIESAPAPIFETIPRKSNRFHRVAQGPRAQFRHPEQKVPSTRLEMAATESSAVPAPHFHAETANAAFTAVETEPKELASRNTPAPMNKRSVSALSKTRTPQVVPPTPQPQAVKQPTTHSKTPRQQAESNYRKANHYFKQGRLADGEASLRRALVYFSEHLKARELLVQVLMRGERWSEAYRVVTQGLRMSPKHPRLACLKAQLLIRDGRLPEALDLLESIPASDFDLEHDLLLAAVYQQSGVYERAEARYRQILETVPRSSVAWVGLAVAQEAQGKSDAALYSFRHVLSDQSLSEELRNYAHERVVALSGLTKFGVNE